MKLYHILTAGNRGLFILWGTTVGMLSHYPFASIHSGNTFSCQYKAQNVCIMELYECIFMSKVNLAFNS